MASVDQPPPLSVLALGTAAGELRALEHALTADCAASGEAGAILRPPCSIARRLAAVWGVYGQTRVFVNACIAGANAIGAAFDVVRSGASDFAIAGGADVLARSSLAGFNTLHALSPTLCRPFDAHRDGTQLAEGAAFVVLEEQASAERAGRRALAEMVGYGMSSDAFHATRSDPAGEGPRRAIARALTDAHITSTDVDYVSAHGTATYQNDLTELQALARVFGPRASSVPLSSVKGQIGHTTGASGAIDFVISVLTLTTGVLPPSVNLTEPMSEFAACDFVLEPGRKTRVRTILSNSFAFGGNNISIVLKAAS